MDTQHPNFRLPGDKLLRGLDKAHERGFRRFFVRYWPQPAQSCSSPPCFRGVGNAYGRAGRRRYEL